MNKLLQTLAYNPFTYIVLAVTGVIGFLVWIFRKPLMNVSGKVDQGLDYIGNEIGRFVNNPIQFIADGAVDTGNAIGSVTTDTGEAIGEKIADVFLENSSWEKAIDDISILSAQYPNIGEKDKELVERVWASGKGVTRFVEEDLGIKPPFLLRWLT